MLDAKDGFGKPVGHAGSRGNPNTGEGRRPQDIYNTYYIPLLCGPSMSFLFCNSSYIHDVHRITRRQQSCMKDGDNLQILLSANQTGCEQRTPERPPSSQAVLRCVQSAGKKRVVSWRQQAAARVSAVGESWPETRGRVGVFQAPSSQAFVEPQRSKSTTM